MKKEHGGKRKGAGRKVKTGMANIKFNLTIELKAALRAKYGNGKLSELFTIYMEELAASEPCV